MLILGLESTCDETSCGIVLNGNTILSNIIASQEPTHAQYGGVVPELASRCHAENFPNIVKIAIAESAININDIDAIAIANEPGLIGPLSVGINFAKGLAISTKKPLIKVNHIEAHLYAAAMNKNVSFPALGLAISGAHTSLFIIESWSSFKLLGNTRDDAIGEVFDKVARMLGLPYPGGKLIEELALSGDPSAYNFKCGEIKNNEFDFSFSGLKTAVLYTLYGQNLKEKKNNIIDITTQRNISAAFQNAAFSRIVKKIKHALNLFKCKSILVGGGVSANMNLQSLLLNNIKDIPVLFPNKSLCTDNGAMIAGLGFWQYNNLLGAEKCLTLKEKIFTIKSLCPHSRSVWEKASY